MKKLQAVCMGALASLSLIINPISADNISNSLIVSAEDGITESKTAYSNALTV